MFEFKSKHGRSAMVKEIRAIIARETRPDIEPQWLVYFGEEAMAFVEVDSEEAERLMSEWRRRERGDA